MENIKKLGSNDYEDFKKIFMIFETEPFYEAWTEEEYQEEFQDFLQNGEMYGIFLEGEICGLITIKPKYQKWSELKLDFQKTIYLSDIAVCKEYRNRGLATKLMKYIIEMYGKDYDLYLRTNLYNSMSEGIARKNGFTVIDGVVQEVTFKRTRDDIPSTDKRKYLIRKSK